MLDMAAPQTRKCKDLEISLLLFVTSTVDSVKSFCVIKRVGSCRALIVKIDLQLRFYNGVGIWGIHITGLCALDGVL